MKITITPIVLLLTGETRIVNKFLWLPKKLRGYDGFEIRWMEKANIRQELVSNGMTSPSKKMWIDQEFV